MFGLIGSLKGCKGVSQKDYEYVLTETGFAGKSDFNFDEFVEVWESHRAAFCGFVLALCLDLWRAEGYYVIASSQFQSACD